MELKDVILSTLAEMEESSSKPESSEFNVKEKITFKEVETIKEERASQCNEVNEIVISEESSKS